jgi:hypothetical protein
MSCHHGLPSRRRVIAAATCFVLVGFAPFATSVHGANLLIGFDNGPLITDGSGLDIDGVINDQIIFGGNYGAGTAVDTLDAQLGARGLATQSIRAAGFATVGIGFTLFAHIELEILYRQALIVGEALDPLGTIGARLGGRL